MFLKETLFLELPRIVRGSRLGILGPRSSLGWVVPRGRLGARRAPRKVV